MTIFGFDEQKNVFYSPMLSNRELNVNDVDDDDDDDVVQCLIKKLCVTNICQTTSTDHFLITITDTTE